MQGSITELYQHVGRYLNPTIRDGVVLDKRGAVKYRIREGRCARTGLTGPVVDYVKSEHGVIPTLTTLLWMFAEQTIPKADGTVIDQRIGAAPNRTIVLTAKHVLTNVPFQAKIPRLKVVKMNDLLRASETQDCLLLAFGQNLDTIFGNSLRHSIGGNIEVNGEFEFGRLKLANTSLSLAMAHRLAKSGIELDRLVRIYRLIVRDNRSDRQYEQLEGLCRPLTPKQQKMLPILRQAAWKDLTLARILHG